ncbi:MAG: hypothetical protein K2N44_15285 [Lachnospiraceae bacterium]|nr:hypothetical protein [Lachnospiraceae bacterium]
MCELDELGLDGEILYRPFQTLSYGERTKLMRAVSRKNRNESDRFITLSFVFIIPQNCPEFKTGKGQRHDIY